MTTPAPATTDWVPIWNLNAPAMPPSGMVPIFDQILTGPLASIDIPNIPQNYAHLRLAISARSDVAATQIPVNLRFNNDSGANYDSEYSLFFGTANTLAEFESVTQTALGLGRISAATAPAGGVGVFDISIQDYASVLLNKHVIAPGYYTQGTTTGNMVAQTGGGQWRSAAAINRITIIPNSGNLVAGSRVTLYGIPAKPVATQTQVSLNSNYVPIADVLLGSAQATIDFTSIPQNFAHLKIVGQGRGDSSGGQMFMKFNNDPGPADYSIGLRHWTEGTTSHADSIAATVNGCAILGDFTTSADPAGRTTAFEIDIPDYTNALFTKAFFAHLINSAATREMFCSGWWTGLTPVSRITLTLNAGNFLAGTHFTLYGISTTPVVSASNVITAPTVSTTLPASPVDQQQAILVDNTSSPTYSWLFQWSALASKWIFIGGTPLKATDQANVNRSITVGGYATYPSAPSITLPRAGLYIVQCGAFLNISTASSTGSTAIAYTVGATVPQDYDAAIIYHTLSGGNDTNLIATCVSPASSKAIAAAGTILAMQGKCNGASGFATNTWIQATPIYVT